MVSRCLIVSRVARCPSHYPPFCLSRHKRVPCSFAKQRAGCKRCILLNLFARSAALRPNKPKQGRLGAAAREPAAQGEFFFVAFYGTTEVVP